MVPSNSSSPFSLAGKVVLLTGGAGIYGRGLTRYLARAGATLVIAARNQAALEAVAQAERDAGHSVQAVTLDQESEESVLALRDRLVSEYGRIDGLVNNAVARPMRSPDAPVSAWAASMATNATGLFAISRAFAEHMAERGGGSIVNISSIQGMVGPDFTLYEGLGLQTAPDYFFHKAGMLNLTRFFAAQFGPRGVRVNAVSPGGFHYDQPEEFVRRYSRKTFLRRMAGEDDLGPPVVFMLSDGARYITGANLAVDGGYTAL
ncbi:MAG: SDR family oxidoreductase [Opitutaceae bacterium]|nr:SDR family oxidoreductase [Opitutaceae bacterium]